MTTRYRDRMAVVVALSGLLLASTPVAAAPCTGTTAPATPIDLGGGTVTTTTADSCTDATGTGGGFVLGMGNNDSVVFANSVQITATNASSGFPDAVHLTGTSGNVTLNSAQLEGAPGGAALFADFTTPGFGTLTIDLNGGTYTAGTGGDAIYARMVGGAAGALDTLLIRAGTTVNGTVRVDGTGAPFGASIFITQLGTINAAGGDAIQVVSGFFTNVELGASSVTAGNISFLAGPTEQGLQIVAGADTTGMTVTAAAGVAYGLSLIGTGSANFDAAALLSLPDAIAAQGTGLSGPAWTISNFDDARFVSMPFLSTDLNASLTLALPDGFTGQVVINPSSTLIVDEPTGHSVTASGTVDLRGTLGKTGDGTLTLTGKIYDNSLSDPPGAINVQGGVLTLGNGDADEITFGDVTIGSSSVLNINSSYAVSTSGTITFNGVFGRLNSTNIGSTPFTYSGAINVTDPIANMNLAGAHVISGDITLAASSSRLDIHHIGAGSLTLSGDVSGPGAFVVFGNSSGLDTITLGGNISVGTPGAVSLGLSSATFDLTGDNSGLQGWLVVENGTLNIDHVNDVGSAVLAPDTPNGILNFAPGLMLTNGVQGRGALNVDSGIVTLTGHITGFFSPGALVKTGGGTLVASDVADPTISVQGGTLVLNGSVASGPAVTIATGATLDIQHDLTIGSLGAINTTIPDDNLGTVTNNGSSDATLTVDYATTGGAASSSAFGGAARDGTSKLGLDVAHGTLTLAGVYDATGDINVQALSTLTLGDGDADEITFGDVTLHSARLNINSSYAINSSGTITIDATSNLLTSTNRGSTPFTYSGAIDATSGVGTMQVTGAHIISGPITVGFGERFDIAKQDMSALTLSSDVGGAGSFGVEGMGPSLGVYDVITLSGDISVGTPNNLGLSLYGAIFNLTGDNSGLQGRLVITDGTLNVDAASDLGSATLVADSSFWPGTINFAPGLTLANGYQGVGALNVDSGTVTLTGRIEGFFAPGSLIKTGNGTLVVSDVADTVISVNGGTLELDGPVAGGPLVSVATGATLDIHGDQTFGALGAAGTFVLDSNAGVVTNKGVADATLTVDYSSSGFLATHSTFRGVIQDGTKAIALDIKDGTLVLGNANTYTGGTAIEAGGGSLVIDATLVPGAGIASSGDLRDDGLLQLVDGTDQRIDGVLSGSGQIDIGGALSNKLTLTGATNTFSGTVTILGATNTLRLENSDSLGTGSVSISAGGGTLSLADGVDFSNQVNIGPGSTLTVSVDDGGTTHSSANLGGPYVGGFQSAGPGTSFVKTGGGTLIADLIDVDTSVNVADGTLVATGGTWSPLPLWNVAAGATIDLNGTSATLGPLSGAGTITNEGSADSGLTIDYFGGAATESTFAGVIKDGASHTTSLQVEEGRLILTNTNTYTGGTLVCACAVLQLGDGSSAGSITGDAEVDGELAFKQPGAYSFGGDIDIEGGTVRVVSGDITLSGELFNTFDDATIIVDGGSLTLSGDNSGLVNDGVQAVEVDVNSGAVLHLTRDESLGTSTPADVFVSDGTIDIANNVTLGSNFFVESNTTATFNVQTGSAHLSADCCVGGILTDDPFDGASAMVKTGAGTLVADYLDVSGVDLGLFEPISGSVTISAGTLLINGDGVIAGPADFTVAAGATLDMQGSNGLGSLSGGGTVTNGGATPVVLGVDYLFNADGQSTFDGVIQDGAQPQGISLAVDDGRLILRNASTYTGITVIGGLTCGCGLPSSVGLQLGDGTTAGSIVSDVEVVFGELDFNEPSATTFANNVELFTNGAIRVMAGDITISGDLVSNALGDGMIFIDGGSLTLTGDNSGLSANYTVAGTLHMANLGSGTVTTVGTVLVYNNGDVVANPVDINSNTTQFSITSGTAEQQGAITETAGPRPMEKIGAGRLIVDSVAITGTTTITAGTLAGGATNAFSANSIVAVAGAGTLSLNGFDQDIEDLSGTGTVVNGTAADATLRINRANGGSSQFDGVIQDGTGGGKLNLSIGASSSNITTFAGALTYTGTTALDSGESLILSGAGTNLTGAFSMGSTDVLTVSNAIGTVRIGGNITGDASVHIQEFGPGLFVLGGDNSGYNGTIVVGGGSLKVETSTALGTQTATISNGTTLIYGDGVAIANGILIDGLLATLEVDANDSAQQLGTISDNGVQHGGFTKTGTGTLTLSGSNTYAGGTGVQAGTLIIAAGAALPSTADVTVSTGATLKIGDFVAATVNTLTDGAGGIGAPASVVLGASSALIIAGGSGTNTFSGQFTGAGSLGFEGGGTWVLTGAGSNIDGSLDIGNLASPGTTGGVTITGDMNSSGTTIVLDGTLTLSNGGTLTSGSTGIVSGTIGAAPLVVITGAGSTWNIAGGLALTNIFGPATSTVTVADGGTLRITTNNLLNIDANGVLNIGSGAGAGAIDVPGIQNNGQIVANFTDSYTLAAGINGSGTFTKQGSGTLTLSSVNGYSGDTNLDGGVLEITNGSGLGASTLKMSAGTTLLLQSNFGSFTNNIELTGDPTINVADNVIVGASGNITDGASPGMLEKIGGGTLVLSGTNTYTGDTHVQAGTLQMDGSASSSHVLVDSGATLSGHGAVGTVTNNGTLSPGDVGIGTLTTNSLTLGAGGLYLVELDNGHSDSVLANGNAVTLGGALGLNFALGSYAPQQYTIIAGASSLSGTFSSIDSLGLPTGFVFDVTNDGSNVYVDLSYAQFIWGANPATSSYATGANWQNGLSPASAVSDQSVLFGATTRSTIDLSGSSQLSLQFETGAPAYTFNLAGGVFSLTGLGIVDNSGNRPTFAMTGGVVQFVNGASAGDAAFTVHQAIVSFANNASAGIAQINSDSGIVEFGDNATAGAATFNHSGGILEFDDHSTAGTATITTSGGIVQFNDNATAGQATLVALAGGSINFSGTGPAGDGKVTAGSIAGAGDFVIGGGELTVGSNNISTEVSGSVSDVGSGGSLVKVGTGRLTISGSADYTGGTIINGGTLQIGNGGNSGSLAGNILDNAALVFNRANSLTVAGSISGTGTVSQIGGGVLSLTGNNSYIGGTFVTGGTLSTDGSGKLGTGDVTLTGGTLRADNVLTMANKFVLNGASDTIDTNGFGISLGGALSGGGTLVKEGAGTLTVTGAANWMGGANVNHGVLTIAGSSIYGGNTTIASGGATLIFNVAGTYAGNIDGGGLVRKQGAGTLVFTGDVLGSFTVEGGTLQIGNGGTSGAVAGNVTANAGTTLAFNRSDATAFNGVIDGAGRVVVQSGALFMGLTQAYIGGTTINSGAALTLGNGGVNGGIVGDLANNGALTINRGNAMTFDGVISGAGTFTKLGGGALILTATNTYSGATTISGGMLAVNGSIASSAVTVNNGGTLGGTGTVGSTTVASGGTIAAGNSIGTLNIAGSLTLQAGSFVTAEFSPGAADLINATGAVSIAGNLSVSFAGGAYLPHQYAIITTTGALTGTFGTAAGNAPTGFAYTVSTDTHNAYLNLIYKQFIWGANPGSTDWFTGANWTNGLTPAAGQDVFFDATTKPSIDIAGTVSELSMQFTTATPSYTFNLSGAGNSLTLTGQGINDTVGNAPTFNVGSGTIMTFANSATAGDARITAQAGGQVIFTGTSNAGSATLTAQGTGKVDFSGTAGAANDNNVTAGSIAGSGSVLLGANRLTAGSNNASTEVSGVISGAGGLTKTGTGTLILSGTNTFTGGLVIANGTVQLGNGGATGSVVGAIASSGTLAFNRSDNITAPAITGAGGVRQMGSGTLTLAGAYTYTGATQVTAGTLALTGSITSVVTVSGGTLAGTGSMSGLSVANGGTVSPGIGGVGTLTVNGVTALVSGSTYAFDATTGASDLISTTGAVSLGGTVVVTITPGSYSINSRIALVTTATGVSGTFGTLTLNGSFGSNIKPVFDYDARHAYLLLRPVAISTLLPPDASENVVDIAKAIDVALLTGSGGDAFGPLADLNQANLVKVLEQMDGEVSNGVPDGAFENLGAFLELLLDPANDNRSGGAGPALSFIAPDDRPSLSLADPVSAVSPQQAQGGTAVFLRGPVSVWGALKGGWSSHDGDAVLGTHPTNVSNGLMALGVDVRPEGQDLVLGAAAALGQVWWNVHPGLGSGHSNSQQFGVYGSKRFGQLYVSMAAAFAQFQSNTVRRVVFGGTNTYQAHVDGQGQGLRAEAGYRFETDGTGLTPYATFQAQGITTSAYDEKTVTGNPAFALRFPHQHETDVSSELGLSADRVLSTANDNALSIEARVGWWHDYSSDISRAGSLLSFPGTSFTVRGVSHPRDAAQLALDLSAEIGGGLSLEAKAQSLLSGNVQEYGGNLALDYRW